jgi:hypothetical protein
MIDRVSKAQAEADAKRLLALKEYLGLLNGDKDNKIGTLVPNFVPPSWAKPGGPSTTMGPFAPTLTKMPDLTQVFPGDFGNGGAAGAPIEVTINAGVGDPEAIARAVEDVLNQSTYRGTSVNRGAGNYIL